MYSERVLEIFKNPPHAGGLQGANGNGKYSDEKSGDQIRVYFKTDDKDVVLEARFKALGSVASIVASSVLCGNIVGLTVKELQKLDSSFITENIDLPEDKQYVAQFVINALNVAIEDFFKDKKRIAVLVDVVNPANVGAIFRSAAAAALR